MGEGTDALREECDALRRVGDALQVEAGRLAEWVRCLPLGMEIPYEARDALYGVEAAAHEWTQIQHKGES